MLAEQHFGDIIVTNKVGGLQVEMDLDHLMKCELLSGLTAVQIRQFLLPLGGCRTIPKGQFLIQYQEKLEYFGIIMQGSVQTMHIFRDGSVSIMDVLKPGEVYGADLLCTKSRISPYYAMASQECVVFMLPAQMITDTGLIPEEIRQRISGELLTLIAQNNMKKEYRLAILSRKGLRERIMTYLTMQANKRQTQTFEIPFSRDELASFLCVNRSALSHELSRMEKEGMIRYRKNCFTLYSGVDWMVKK